MLSPNKACAIALFFALNGGGGGRRRSGPSLGVDGFFSPSPRRNGRLRLQRGPVVHRAAPPTTSSSRRARGSGGYNQLQRGEERSRGRYRDEGEGGGDGSSSSFYDGGHEENYGMVARREQEERLSASIGCPHFGTCPGCVRDSNVAEIDVVESARLYFSSPSVQKHVIGGGDYSYSNDGFYRVEVPSPITRWRTQAKLAVSAASNWSRAAGCDIGLYARGSHDVLSIPDCRVHHPSINRAVDVVARATREVRTPAYQEDAGEGLLRYVQCQVELSTGKVCLSLVMNAEKFKECVSFALFAGAGLLLVEERGRAWPFSFPSFLPSHVSILY